jgi:hypothetical protein
VASIAECDAVSLLNALFDPDRARRVWLSGKLSLMAINFTWYSARGVSSFLFPPYLSIGLNIVEVGVALGISGASLLFFEVAWGFVLDRLGTGKTLPAAEALSGRVMGAYAAAEDVGIILGPLVGAFSWAGYGLRVTYLALGFLLLVVLLLYFAAYYRRK